jgi:CubicO group peptidase (beta-lactamase class C family)
MTEPFDPVLDLVRGEVRRGRLPSAVVGVASSRGVLALEAFGAARGRHVRVDDPYLLFSASKPVVGLAALQLVERGLLSLRTPLADALPGWGAGRQGDEVTLWHLMTHTAGITEATVSPDGELIDQLLQAPQLFEAGRYALYSNVAFAGIGALVSAVVGKPLETYLPETLNALPGLGGLSYDPTVPVVPIEGTDRVAVDVERFRALRHPAGALSARAADLLALGSMLLAGDRALLHPGTVAAATRPQTTGIPRILPDPLHLGPGTGQEWGLTFNMRTSPTLLEHRLYGHGGLSGCQWWLYPEHDACLVLLTNLMNPLDVGVDLDTVHNAFTTCLDPIERLGLPA